MKTSFYSEIEVGKPVPLVSRRRFLLTATALAAVGLRPGLTLDAAPEIPRQRYKIAVCDWMLLKRQKIRALELGKQIGLDGVEVDMGSLGDREDMKNALRGEEVRQQFLDASKKLNVEICSLALSAFYGHSYADHDKSDALTAEWIDIMRKMGVKVGFLPLLGKGDVKDNADNRRKTIERLRKAAPSAEKAGVVIGVETNLDAEGHKKFLDAIGSPDVRVYYNLGRMLAAGYDIYQELRDLDRDRFCQIHCKEGEVWLGNGLIDFPKVKSALDDIGWSGWLVVERSRMPGKSVVENYTANAKYLKSVFQTGA